MPQYGRRSTYAVCKNADCEAKWRFHSRIKEGDVKCLCGWKWSKEDLRIAAELRERSEWNRKDRNQWDQGRRTSSARKVTCAEDEFEHELSLHDKFKKTMSWLSELSAAGHIGSVPDVPLSATASAEKPTEPVSAGKRQVKATKDFRQLLERSDQKRGAVEKTARKVASLASQLEAARVQLVEDEAAYETARNEATAGFAALQAARAAQVEEDAAALAKQKLEKTSGPGDDQPSEDAAVEGPRAKRRKADGGTPDSSPGASEIWTVFQAQVLETVKSASDGSSGDAADQIAKGAQLLATQLQDLLRKQKAAEKPEEPDADMGGGAPADAPPADAAHESAARAGALDPAEAERLLREATRAPATPLSSQHQG